MSKIQIRYTNFLGQVVTDHKTFKQEGKELNKRLNEVKRKALNGKVEVIKPERMVMDIETAGLNSEPTITIAYEK